MLSKKQRIVVLGAGFSGLRAIRKLARVDAEIILIDRHNYHTFIPLLYQVAAGFISPETIAYPIRKYLHSFDNTRFIQAEVQNINFQRKKVEINRTIDNEVLNLTYDYLIIATGSQTKFLGVDGAVDCALPMRSLNDAVRIHDRLISNFEKATVSINSETRKQLLTIAIVGGGATGVELAGALNELIKGTLAKDYPTINLEEVRIILIHSQTRLLTDYPPHLGEYTSRQLRRRGVKVHLDSYVSEVMSTGIRLDDGTKLEAATIIWAAGVEANYPPIEEEIPTASKEKICVNSTLQLPDYPEVYAVGDVAYITQVGKPLLGIAPEALQQGTTVAHNLKRQLRGLSPQPFNYFNKGTAAIIARNTGVAYLFGRIPLKGFWAWLLWLAIHFYYLPGIGNRLNVFGSWLYDYVTRQRNFRQLFLYRRISQSSINKNAIAYRQ